MEKKSPKIKQFEESLADLEAYIRQLWDFLPIPVGLVGPQNFVLSTTRELTNFSGHQEGEIVGKPLDDLFVEDKLAEKLLQEVQKRKRPNKQEANFITKEERIISVEISTMRREDEVGNFIGYFFSIIDISKRKQFEQKLKKEVEDKTQQLQERIEELEKFRKLTEGRELKMVELKEKIKKLKEKLEGGDYYD